MKTQSKILISIGASLAVSVVLGVFLVILIRGIGDDLARGRAYSEISQKTISMEVLVASFTQKSDQRQKQQFDQVRSSLTNLLKKLKSSNVREESLIRQIHRNNRELIPLLDQFLSQEPAQEGPKSELKKILAAQLLNKVHFISDDTSRLRQISETRILSAYQNMAVTGFIIIIVLMAANVIISLISGRSIIQAEEALRESEDRMRLALDSARFGTFDYNLLTGDLRWDVPMKRIWGIPADEQLDYTRALERIHPEDRARVNQTVEASLGPSANGNYECEFRIVWPNGSIHWIIWKGRVYFQGRGKQRRAVRMVGVQLDISERKWAEVALKKAYDELEFRVQERTAELDSTVAKLEQVNQELQEFVFIASHDLQEPLRKIQTFTEMTKKRCAPLLDKTSQDYMDRVSQSAGRMRQLLNELLKFSRVTTQKEPFKEVNLFRIAGEAADVFEATLKDKGGKIEIKNLPAIEADESQMGQLFQNLIGNALKFRDNKTPDIQVYGQVVGREHCLIIVKDNGIGFDPEYAEDIFKPFERLHGQGEYEGTGMGLAICRKIMERHGGTIRAESEPGKGATFIIKLPVKQVRKEVRKEK